jgi:hypothetical protein
MYSVYKFKNILVDLVSYVGKSFPVMRINTISFYKDDNLMAACFWENDLQQLQKMNMHKMLPGASGPSCVIYNLQEYLTSTEADVEGTDVEGRPFALHCNINFITNKNAA